MPKYTVELTKTIIWVAKIQIDSPNADLAADQAQQLAVKEMNGGGQPPWGYTEWELEDEDIQVTDEPYTEDC